MLNRLALIFVGATPALLTACGSDDGHDGHDGHDDACYAESAGLCEASTFDGDYGSKVDCSELAGSAPVDSCPSSGRVASCVLSDDCGGTDLHYYEDYVDGSADALLEAEVACDGCHEWVWHIPLEERPGYSGAPCDTHLDCGALERCHKEDAGAYCWAEEGETGVCVGMVDACADEETSPGLGCDGLCYRNRCEMWERKNGTNQVLGECTADFSERNVAEPDL